MLSIRRANLEEVIERIKSDPRKTSHALGKKIERIQGKFAKMDFFYQLRDKRDLSDIKFTRKLRERKRGGKAEGVMDERREGGGRWRRGGERERREGEGIEGG